MAYTSRRPRPPLSEYIDDIYHLDAPPPAAQLKVFPMPTLHLMVNLGAGFDVRVGDEARSIALSESWCTGMWDVCHTVRYPASNISLYGIHFKPGGAAPFLSVPVSDLRNQIAPLDAFWGRRAHDVRERLEGASSIQAGLSILEGAMLQRLRETNEKFQLVRQAIKEMARHQGMVPIRRLSDQIGVSHNHLGIQFNHFVGLTPKQLARTYRFARVLDSVDPRCPVDWTGLAHTCGFFDQSHFNKEFAAFTGFTPSGYLDQRVRLHNECPDYEHDPGNLPLVG